MDRPGLTNDPRFVDHRSRGVHMAELDDLIARWTVRRSSAGLLEALHEAGVPCGRVYAPVDMVDDPHFRARESLVDVPDPDHGQVLMPNVAPKLSRTPGRVRWSGPELGAHTDAVLTDAGLNAHEITDLRQSGVI